MQRLAKWRSSWAGGEHGAGHRSALSGARGRDAALRQIGVDEIFLGKRQKFRTVVNNLNTGEPLSFGAERKKETLDEFFGTQLSVFQQGAVRRPA